MITKERLEELIEQGAIIFGKYREYILRNREEKGDDFWWKRQVEIINNELHYIYEDSDYYENDDLYIDLKDLYETKEDAEFIAKYHTQRPVYFNPPTWEEFDKRKFYDFQGKNGRTYYIQYLTYCDLLVVYDNDDCYTNQLTGDVIDHTYENTNIFKETPTKENYYKAVEKARKLFLGLGGEEDA